MSENDKTDKLPTANPSPSENPETAQAAITQEVGWRVDKGRVRANNEDSIAAVTMSQASDTETQSVGVYAVADGMGGHAAGEIASKLAVRTAIRKLVEDVADADLDMPESYEKWLKSAVSLSNQIVRRRAQQDDKDMGTTLVMAVVVGHDVHIVNVGDSRAYIISSKGIRQITHDQSFVQLLIDTGAITEEEAVGHPHRNILTQSVGSTDDIAIDLFDETLGNDDYLLLCSDGLWGMLSNEKIWQIVRNAPTPSEACQALVDATNEAGGFDNIAAVLVRLGTLRADAAKAKDDDDTLELPKAAEVS